MIYFTHQLKQTTKLTVGKTFTRKSVQIVAG
jgi:hypothetical protein